MTTPNQFTSLDEKAAQVESFLDYLGSEWTRIAMNGVQNTKRVSYMTDDWFCNDAVLQVMLLHPFPVTFVSTWEPMEDSTVSAIGPFVDSWADEHPLIQVELVRGGIRLTMVVAPEPEWTDEVWQDCLYEVWFKRLDFLEDLEQYATVHGLTTVKTAPSAMGAWS
jgi:hypothetical protein